MFCKKGYADSLNDKQLSFWLDQWLLISKNRIAKSTYIKYFNSIEKHIKPYLGSVNLSEINTCMIEEYINNQLEHGNLITGGTLSKKTVSEFLIILESVCKYAITEGYAIRCQFSQIAIKREKPDTRVLTRQEEIRLVNVLTTDTNLYKIGILLCLCTGIRIGEACALTWKNVSFDNQTIRINSTMQRLQHKSINNVNLYKTEIIITSPKTDAAKRIIPLPQKICAILLDYKSNDEQFVLCKNNGLVEPRLLQNKFKLYLKQANIQDINFHALRHTFATRWIESGGEIKALSEILGHASVQTTLNRYVHSSLEQKRKGMEKLVSVSYVQ